MTKVGARHDEDREREGLLPADPVAEVAPDDAADRAHDEGEGEDRVGGDQRGAGVGFGKEHRGDHRGEEAVGGIVEPFDEGAHEARDAGAAQHDAALVGRPGAGTSSARVSARLISGGLPASGVAARTPLRFRGAGSGAGHVRGRREGLLGHP